MSSWTLVEKYFIPFLDYQTRCNLRLCSKSDKLAVDLCPFFAETIQISEEISREVVDKSWIRVDIDTFTIWFIGKNNITKVDRAWDGEIETDLSEIRTENRYIVARRFLDRYRQFGARTITINMLRMRPSEEWKLRCDELYIHLTSHETWATNWLKTVDPPRLEKFDANCWNLDGIGEVIAKVEITKTLKLGEESDLNDEQLRNVRALNLDIDSSRITPMGLKSSLDRFLRNGKRDDELILHAFLPEGFETTSLFSDSLKYKEQRSRIPSEKNFLITGGFTNIHGVQEAREFCCWSNSIFCFIRRPPKSPGRHIYHMWPLTRHF